MTRIKLTFPEKSIFTYKSTISVNQINYGGHLGNDSVLTIFQDARIAFFLSNKLAENNIGENLGIIQNDAAVQYLSEGHLHEQIITEVAILPTSKIGFDVYYKITAIDSGKVISIGKTGMITYSYTNKKIASTPDSFLKLIA